MKKEFHTWKSFPSWRTLGIKGKEVWDALNSWEKRLVACTHPKCRIPGRLKKEIWPEGWYRDKWQKFWTSDKDMSSIFHSYFEGTAIGVKKLRCLWNHLCFKDNLENNWVFIRAVIPKSVQLFQPLHLASPFLGICGEIRHFKIFKNHFLWRKWASTSRAHLSSENYLF